MLFAILADDGAVFSAVLVMVVTASIATGIATILRINDDVTTTIDTFNFSATVIGIVNDYHVRSR